MTFVDSVRTCLRNYAMFEGRASRSEYWWFMLFFFGVVVILGSISETAANIAVLLLLLPQLAVGARRLHDIGKSAWFLLIGLVPIVGTVILIVWAIKRGEAEANLYGPPPADTQAAPLVLPPGGTT